VEECTFAALRRVRAGRLEPLEPVVDPDVVFGPDADLVEPLALMAAGGVDRAAQVLCDRLPCAMACEEILLQPGETAAFVQIFGHAPRRDLLAAFLASFPDEASLDAAEAEARALVDGLTAPALTVSSVPALDAYARQNFLDNVLRGGAPALLPSADGPRPVWLHTRRHGDMERDYNFFSVPARPLSEGAGNFRDVCQNRRHNAWFHADSAEADLRLFCELVQADGYNPLSVEGWRWRAPKDLDLRALFPGVHGEPMDQLGGILHRAFAPGELAQWIQWNRPGEDALARTREILALCHAHISAHGHEGGYWVDHWIYIVDLVESLLGVRPDTIARTLATTACGWWDEGVDVLPRAQRAERLDDRWVQSRALRPAERRVALPPTSLLGKLATLAVLRAHTLDPEGRGVEMEAGRPGWNDAMNGLPGVFGSCTRETGAVRDLCALLLEILPEGAECELPAPAAALLREAPALLNPSRPYPYHAAADRREAYRAALRSEDAARAEVVTASALKAALQAARDVAHRGLEASVDPATGLAHLYFARDTAIAPGANGASAAVDAATMKPRPLPLFLEAQVALLRARHSADAARASRRAVRQSPLMDDVLRMYKLNESLASQPYSIGRARTFSPGWYENESIWTHMSYKYLVELLRGGAAAEFHEDARTMLVPFMDPATYGRSTLENSSFIASSACPDEKAWGRGFVARLSGSTAEFIHLWVLMTSGERPFTVAKDGSLELRLLPALPGEWFTREARDVEFLGRAEHVPADAFAFAFLNQSLVVYHNASRRDTFGERPARPAAIRVDGALVARDGVLRGDDARRVREGLVRRIDVVLE
jgi:hypothetical protein